MDSDSEEENVVRYGTPLDPFEEDEIPSKRRYQEQPDQYAVDAHGRRRFHGAFTGGFSAGFGNSVGTIEGWAPTAFKSSRADKAKTVSQKPEDYMDDEDRSEFGIAPRYMQTQSEFSGQKRCHQPRYYGGPIPGEPVLEQLVRAVHETAALRMLRAMGWREGQGTGDRITRKGKRRAKEQHKVYGCYMPSEMKLTDETESEKDSSDSEFEYDTLFAPDDYEPYILRRKNDRFGLGYSGLSRHSVLGNLIGEYGNSSDTPKSHLVMNDKGKKVSIHGEAFGVGALENEDEDIYATEDMSHYDFAIGSASHEKRDTKQLKAKGSNVLEGFVKAIHGIPAVPNYPSPALPPEYTPAAAGMRRSRFEPSTHAQRNQGLGRHELTAKARGALLGETPLLKVDIQKVQTTNKNTDTQIVGRNVNFITTSIVDSQQSELDYISIKDSGKEIKKVFKPFASNPLKQARYEKYLNDKNSILQEDTNTDRLNEWERERELAEFDQAAKLYRPLTGAMGDRFTHATEPDEGDLNPLCAVAKSVHSYGLATSEQIEAVKQGLCGVMTRKETQWQPESLVCKRFNVPDPGGIRLEPTTEDKPKLSYSIFSYMESSAHDKESFTREQSKFSGSKSLSRDSLPKDTKNGNDQNKANTVSSIKFNADISKKETENNSSKRITVAELFLKESEKALVSKESEVTETINKFDKMDLYKSIFLSDSENEDTVGEGKTTTVESDFKDITKNVERNLSPPRGIFANIDFDELNSWKRNTETQKIDKNDTKSDINKSLSVSKETSEPFNELKVENSDLESQIYGPKIPDNLKNKVDDQSATKSVTESILKPAYRSRDERYKSEEIQSSSSSDSWIDMKEIKSKLRKKKKNKKHKSKHKKSKKYKNKDREVNTCK